MLEEKSKWHTGLPIIMANDVKTGELAREWPVVATCFAGLVLAVGTIVTYTAGVFAVAITNEFGWTQADFTLSLMFFYYALVPGSIICGELVDRFGPRRLILISNVGLAIGLVAIGFLPASVMLFAVAYALVGLVSIGTLPVTYARVIAGRFDLRRGTALGIAMTGVGVGSVILPTISQYIIELWGWRAALQTLAAAVLLFGFTSAWIFIPRDNPSGKAAVGERGHLRRAWRDDRRPLLGLGAISLISGLVLTGLVVNMARLAVSKGFESSALILFGVAMGVSIIVGRLGIGMLMDRLPAAKVLGLFLLGPALGAVMLGFNIGQPIMLAAVVLIGLAQGAEVDAVAYIVSRYFPKDSFGTVYGFMFALFTVGAANGPLVFAKLSLAFDSATPGLWLFALLAAFSALISFLLAGRPKLVQAAA